ncbi:hypothetical protein DFP73DRAFT_611746 [Morchella snyderi]|nr:hypothetical protein DFP73DRAFT_611746 [Morchella snyderi]
MATSNRVLDSLDYSYESCVQVALDSHAANPVPFADRIKYFEMITSGVQALSKLYLDEAMEITKRLKRIRGLMSDVKRAQKDSLITNNGQEGVKDNFDNYSELAASRLSKEFKRAIHGVTDCDYALVKFGDMVAEAEEFEEKLDLEEMLENPNLSIDCRSDSALVYVYTCAFEHESIICFFHKNLQHRCQTTFLGGDLNPLLPDTFGFYSSPQHFKSANNHYREPMAPPRPAPKASVGKSDVLRDTKNRTISKYSEAPCGAGIKPMMKENDLKPMEEDIDKINPLGESGTKETSESASTLGSPMAPVIDSFGLNLIRFFTRDNTVPFPDEPNQEYFRPIEAIVEMIQTINEGGDSLEAWKKMDSYPMLTKEEMRQWALKNGKGGASPDHSEKSEEKEDRSEEEGDGSEEGGVGGEE